MYDAMIVKLTHISRIDGADRIVSAKVHNGSVDIATVIVGIDSKEGDVGIYFSPDTQLSELYCNANDLVAIYDGSGKKISGGYLGKNRRVTAQKFKGVKSEGLFMPLSSLHFTDELHLDSIPLMILGDTFTEINGVEICRKYFNEKTLREQKARTPKKETKVFDFHEHVDTEQLIYRIDDIPSGAHITITEKLHGTSHRVGNVLVKQQLSWVKRFVNWFGRFFGTHDPIFKETAYEIVHGSRRVIIDDSPGYYGSNEFRFTATDKIKDIPPGMIVYGEIVGYAGNTPIMNPHSTKEYKELKKEYGATIVYNYGCNPGECKFYIYRITMNGIDLSWQEVQNWARTLGYEVPYTATSFIYDDREMSKEELLTIVKQYAEDGNIYAKSRHGNHISEGVVLRIDYNDKVWFLKYKSFMFRVLEGITKDSGIVDLEEVS